MGSLEKYMKKLDSNLVKHSTTKMTHKGSNQWIREAEGDAKLKKMLFLAARAKIRQLKCK